MPLPMGSALFVSLLQSKVPPDIHGPIFALDNQLGFVGATASFLPVGPLVDRASAGVQPAGLVGGGLAGRVGRGAAGSARH
jgi:hypothetical protein